ncbi:nucleotidyltransferase family protein [Hippea sp. KM1]|uniref:nucleotidyltransferase family protein n=1 Tax=Hippea sp. KM1 TaxID=944481 RepID=UPI00046CDE03|nr:nucleotidyltransferase family protein [Hippea sp. KM1]
MRKFDSVTHKNDELTHILSFLKSNKQYLQSKFHVKEIGVFGTMVRGEQSNDSDIDILVKFDKYHKDFLNYMRLKHYLEKIFNKKVDLVTKSAIKSQIKEEILNEVIYV